MHPLRALVPALSAALAAAALALPATAPAKGIAALDVCGSGPPACHAVEARALRAAEDGARVRAAPRAAAAFYVLRAHTVDAGDGAVPVWTAQWIPSANAMRVAGDAVWTAPAPRLTRALRRAARGLRARPARTLGPLVAPTPRARVVEVYSAADAAPPRHDRPAWPALAAILAAGLLLGAAALAARRWERRPATLRPGMR